MFQQKNPFIPLLRIFRWLIPMVFIAVQPIAKCSTEPLSVPDIPSIHILELWAHQGIEPGMHNKWIQPLRREKLMTRTVYGWYPYWMGNAYLNLQWDLLTHISFFSLEATPTGDISDDHGWPGSWSGLISTAQAAGVTLTVTCSLFGSSDINTLINSSANRANLISNLVQECLDGDAEGINIDFEGTSLNKANLVLFMQELQSAFSTAIPGAHISMATPAVDWNGCFDYDQLAASSDVLIPMCYGYHYSGGDPGPVSPLTHGTVWSQYCVESTVDDYLDPGYGIDASQLCIGVPYYGYDWLVSGDPSTYPASDGPGNATARTFSYIMTNHSGYTKHWDSHSQTPWYYYYSGSDPRQVWYDDDVSLGLKYDLVNNRDLAGIGIWALGYDGSYSQLWDALDSHFSATPTPTPEPGALPATSPAGVSALVLVLGLLILISSRRKPEETG